MRARRALKGSLATALLAAALGASLSRCGQAILTAPAGSLLHITANPLFIPAHGGVSVISVLVVEPAGTVVPDGTVVQFFTTLGTIDEQGRTNDGVARVNLLANGLSGVATVTAVSGGPAPSPSSSGSPSPSPTNTPPNPIPTPTPRPSATPTPRGGGNEPRLAVGDGEGQASLTVAIGTAMPTRVIVTADPQRITQPRSSRITAIVIDANGNPVANVPVFFSILTPNGPERFDSGGDPVFTDTNGEAHDLLRTDAPVTAPPRNVTVQAQTATGQVANVAVTIN